MLRGANEENQEEDFVYNKTLFQKYPARPSEKSMEYALRFEENALQMQKIIQFEEEEKRVGEKMIKA